MKEKMQAVFRRLNVMRRTRKGFLLSVVILLELLAIASVATYAWVETISSIKIIGENGKIRDDYIYTDGKIAPITVDPQNLTEIDLSKFFREAGDMHLAPASSANGTDFYFPITAKTNSSVSKTYRRGTMDDISVSYISFSIRLTSSSNADYYFYRSPTISAKGSDIRFSITVDGGEDPDETKIYGETASSSSVVNGTTASTTATQEVLAISDHLYDASNPASVVPLFSTEKNKSQIVTFRIWLQKHANDDDDDINNAISENINITNFKIASVLSPRKLHLVPTDVWNVKDSNNQYPVYYAWMWKNGVSGSGTWIKATDNEDGSYTVSYDGTNDKVTFVKCKPGTTSDSPDWNKDVIKQTVDLTVPNKDVVMHPAFFISGEGSNKQSATGVWESATENLPKRIKIGYVDGCETYGTIGITSYGKTNSKGSVTKDSVPVSSVQNPETGYVFDGWYLNKDGTSPKTPDKSVINAAPAAGMTETYYAKFVPAKKVTVHAILNGTETSGLGTLQLTQGSASLTSSNTTLSSWYAVGSEVEVDATAAEGYTFGGIYNEAVGGTEKSTYTIEDSNIECYASFTAIDYNVTVHAVTIDSSGNSTTDDPTGGTVKIGYASSGATSTKEVAYQTSAALEQSTTSGYRFLGWYTDAAGGTELNPTDGKYLLNTAGNVDIYARFAELIDSGYALRGDFNEWTGGNMYHVYGSTEASITLNLAEGTNDFKVLNGSTWYGGSNSYLKIHNSTQNGYTLESPGHDIKFESYGGTYTFTFNTDTKKISVKCDSCDVSTVVISFDVSSVTNMANDSPIIWMEKDGDDGKYMEKVSDYVWKVEAPVDFTTSNKFNRNNPSNNSNWNSWNAGARGTSTTYKLTSNTAGSWQ